MAAPCLHEGTVADKEASGTCKSQPYHNGACRVLSQACSLGGIHNDNNNPGSTVPSLFNFKVKAEPLEETIKDCIPQNNPQETAISQADADLNSNSELHSLGLSSCSMRPKLKSTDTGQVGLHEGRPTIFPEMDSPGAVIKKECVDEPTADFIDHFPLRKRMLMLTSTIVNDLTCGEKADNGVRTVPSPGGGSVDTTKANAKRFSLKRKRKKTATYASIIFIYWFLCSTISSFVCLTKHFNG